MKSFKNKTGNGGPDAISKRQLVLRPSDIGLNFWWTKFWVCFTVWVNFERIIRVKFWYFWLCCRWISQSFCHHQVNVLANFEWITTNLRTIEFLRTKYLAPISTLLYEECRDLPPSFKFLLKLQRLLLKEIVQYAWLYCDMWLYKVVSVVALGLSGAVSLRPRTPVFCRSASSYTWFLPSRASSYACLLRTASRLPIPGFYRRGRPPMPVFCVCTWREVPM